MNISLAAGQMAELQIEGNELVLHLTRVEEFEALHGDLRAPLSAVRTQPRCELGERLQIGVRGDVLFRAGPERHFGDGGCAACDMVNRQGGALAAKIDPWPSRNSLADT